MIQDNQINKNYRQIIITDENYQRLKKIGSFQESFNDVISKLLERYEDFEHNIINRHK